MPFNPEPIQQDSNEEEQKKRFKPREAPWGALLPSLLYSLCSSSRSYPLDPNSQHSRHSHSLLNPFQMTLTTENATSLALKQTKPNLPKLLDRCGPAMLHPPARKSPANLRQQHHRR